MKKAPTMMDLLSALTEDLTAQDILSADLISGLSSAITKQRINMGLSQSELAAKLGRSQSTISKWENGDMNFTIEALADIAIALNMELAVELKPTQPAPKQGAYQSQRRCKIISFPKALHASREPEMLQEM